jgi:acetoacetate decarboxylase
MKMKRKVTYPRLSNSYKNIHRKIYLILDYTKTHKTLRKYLKSPIEIRNKVVWK